MSDLFVAVGCTEFNRGDHSVEIRIDNGQPCKSHRLTAKTARRIARKLYWAARMVDGLNSIAAEKETTK